MYNSGESQWNITVVVSSGVDLTVRPWRSPHSHTRLLSARSIELLDWTDKCIFRILFPAFPPTTQLTLLQKKECVKWFFFIKITSKITAADQWKGPFLALQMSTHLPRDFFASLLNGSLDRFDAMASYSSLEHSGLGRYGDALNPWGDQEIIS